jgi:hypothetical protein
MASSVKRDGSSPPLPNPPSLPANLVGKGPPHGKVVITITVLLLIPPLLAVVLRCYVRAFRVKAVGLDDYFILLALVSQVQSNFPKHCRSDRNKQINAIGITIAIIFESIIGSPTGPIGITPEAMKVGPTLYSRLDTVVLINLWHRSPLCYIRYIGRLFGSHRLKSPVHYS